MTPPMVILCGARASGNVAKSFGALVEFMLQPFEPHCSPLAAATDFRKLRHLHREGLHGARQTVKASMQTIMSRSSCKSGKGPSGPISTLQKLPVHQIRHALPAPDAGEDADTLEFPVQFANKPLDRVAGFDPSP